MRLDRLARMNIDPTGEKGRLRGASKGLERDEYLNIVLKRIEYV